MADLKISALPASTTPLAGTETLPIVQSSTTKQVSVANLTAGRRIATAGMDASIGGSAHGVKVTGITGGNQDFWALRNGSTVIQEGPNITLQSATGTTYAATMQMGPTGDTLFFMYDGSSWNQRFAMTTAGNLAISTSGQGIDFSATPGTGTSELLADYEEGTWTPNQGNGLTVVGTFSSSGRYTKVGRIVTVQGVLSAVTSVAIPVGASEMCTNLPFSSSPAYSGSMYNAALTSSVGVACSGTAVYSAGAMGATTSITFSITYTV
jgi:hypothetical protein